MKNPIAHFSFQKDSQNPKLRILISNYLAWVLSSNYTVFWTAFLRFMSRNFPLSLKVIMYVLRMMSKDCSEIWASYICLEFFAKVVQFPYLKKWSNLKRLLLRILSYVCYSSCSISWAWIDQLSEQQLLSAQDKSYFRLSEHCSETWKNNCSDSSADITTYSKYKQLWNPEVY